MTPRLLVMIGALLCSGCSAYSINATPPTSSPSASEILVRARGGNWYVRAFADTVVHEGRVAFVESGSATIGRGRVAIVQVDSVQRHVISDLGGRREGAVIGVFAGFLLGYVARAFWEYGIERDCGPGCSIGIYVPSIFAMTLIGSTIGSIIEPAKRTWVPIWRRE